VKENQRTPDQSTVPHYAGIQPEENSSPDLEMEKSEFGNHKVDKKIE